ncbi:MAG: hypothetical protein GF349_01355 [Candidatus Magasanikbacteria bacterium]|nr:hypothetical protein [Candidatus Magasanikbacteria bacterium]
MKELNIDQYKQKEVKEVIAISDTMLQSMTKTARRMDPKESMRELSDKRGFYVLRQKDDRFIHLHKMELNGESFWLGQIKLHVKL